MFEYRNSIFYSGVDQSIVDSFNIINVKKVPYIVENVEKSLKLIANFIDMLVKGQIFIKYYTQEFDICGPFYALIKKFNLIWEIWSVFFTRFEYGEG